MPRFIRNYSFSHKSVFYPRKARDSISIRETGIPLHLNFLHPVHTGLIHAGLCRQKRKAAAPAGHLCHAELWIFFILFAIIPVRAGPLSTNTGSQYQETELASSITGNQSQLLQLSEIRVGFFDYQESELILQFGGIQQ